MPRATTQFEIAGEIKFPSRDKLEDWLRHPIDAGELPELGQIYPNLSEIAGTVADAFGTGVHLFRDGATVRIAATDLYEELADPGGRVTQGAACACALAARFGGEGTVDFSDLTRSNSFVIELAGGEYRLQKPDAQPGRNEAYRRAMADVRRKYEDEAG